MAHCTDTVLCDGPGAGAIKFHYPARAVQGFIGGGKDPVRTFTGKITEVKRAFPTDQFTGPDHGRGIGNTRSVLEPRTVNIMTGRTARRGIS